MKGIIANCYTKSRGFFLKTHTMEKEKKKKTLAKPFLEVLPLVPEATVITTTTTK